MRRALTGAGVTALALAGSMLVAPAGAGAGTKTTSTGKAATAQAQQFAVLFADGASAAQAKQAITRAGGEVLKVNSAIGEATVRSADANFLGKVMLESSLAGAARNTILGRAPAEKKASAQDVEKLTAERAKAKSSATKSAATKKSAAKGKKSTPGAPAAEPLGDLQWDNQMINATPAGSYAVQRGDSRVKVGIMDTGVDGSHPDIAPNFDAADSRNFTTDIEAIDGACDTDPDGSCSDPADVDENGHGTHLAGTIGAALNGIGISGVAPDVTLVNVRAGQDSGYFFLQPTVDALTYSGDIGIDVVNMSFYIDPWLFNCAANPADSPEQQMEQRTIIAATQRALDYAHSKGVTLVAAEGNGHTDLGMPMFDDSSPDFPAGAAHPRTVDNGCLNLPTEGNHVIGVTSLGASERKAYYSDFGVEQADISAPGGDYYDPATQIGASTIRDPRNLILSTYPKSLAIANGELNDDGSSKTPFVVEDHGAYYQYLQGTSMASPHAAGVAALIVSQYGHRDGKHKGELTLSPKQTQKILYRTARDHACPTPRFFEYGPDRSDIYDVTCEGPATDNGFYGNGIIDALSAVSSKNGK